MVLISLPLTFLLCCHFCYLSGLQHIEIQGVTYFFQLCLFISYSVAGRRLQFCPKCKCPQVICGNHMTKICKVCIFGGSKMPILGIKNAKICKKNCFAPNASNSHVGVSNDQNLHFLWAKMPKTAKKNFKNLVCPKCPPKSFGDVQ